MNGQCNYLKLNIKLIYYETWDETGGGSDDDEQIEAWRR